MSSYNHPMVTTTTSDQSFVRTSPWPEKTMAWNFASGGVQHAAQHRTFTLVLPERIATQSRT
jgi:hypothetical protein